MTHQRDRTLATSTLARVEGEGAMHVRVRGSEVDEVRFDICESPRFSRRSCSNAALPCAAVGKADKRRL